MSDVPLKLSPHEANSPVWQKIEAHYRPKLAKYRARLENPTTPADERQDLAWKIAGIKDLLNLANQEKGDA